VDLTVPALSLVVLAGSSGAGKSTFAARHFGPFEVLSSDHYRGVVSNDETSQSATDDAFEVLHFVLGKRLAAGHLTVVDATNVQPEWRRALVEIAREHDVLPVLIVFDLPERVIQERNAVGRGLPAGVVARHISQLRRGLRAPQREGFRYVYTFRAPEEADAATIVRQPLWNDRRDLRGPFDIVGDVHGCVDELRHLLEELGYLVEGDVVTPPEGRTAVFLGDLVDRGPDTPAVLRLVMGMVAAGTALCVPGNHDAKLVRALRGRNVQLTHGLAESLAQLERETPDFRAEVATFLDGLVSHYVLDDGRLVVAHAGMKERYQGRGSRRVREFALYGDTTGESDELGLPVRYPWADEYRGSAVVVYGHTPAPQPEWLNRTINIDTGCVFGGALTALRYPEMTLVSVPARQTYAVPARPFSAEPRPAPALTAQQRHDDLLDLADVTGRRIVQTRLQRAITIREEHAAAALEVMSRFAVDPRWLVYLPPTMSPSETSQEPGLLEHPAEAFAYYRNQGVPRVICEAKHMGSRAIVVVCRDAEIARARFGVPDGSDGAVYTRTGRPFFDADALQSQLLARMRGALEASGIWEELATGWAVLDCELLPWSAKAQELLRQQYAAVGAASRAALAESVTVLEQAAANGSEVAALIERQRSRSEMAAAYVAAYGRYCWPVQSLSDYRLAPFHLLATEGRVHADRDHGWHMQILARLCAADELLLETPSRVVETTDPASQAEAVSWWHELTERGGEGIVVKPLDFVVRGPRGLAQPAVKCRGREYLRIIYGPEYTAPEHLQRLRRRGLAAKRSLAVREFALGLEALERFVRREPLRRVHECVFAVLALESEPVDPRL
jgi:protein phosphatase